MPYELTVFVLIPAFSCTEMELRKVCLLDGTDDPAAGHHAIDNLKR